MWYLYIYVMYYQRDIILFFIFSFTKYNRTRNLCDMHIIGELSHFKMIISNIVFNEKLTSKLW